MQKKDITVLMLVEFFHPFDRGGSEWSVYHLARELTKHNVISRVFTPNYGSSSFQVWRGIAIRRFWFPRKLRKYQSIAPIWFANPLWWLLSFFAVFWDIIHRRVDVIHVHSKSFLPAAAVAGFLTGKPVVVTMRDYYVLCPYGLCLREKRAYHRCSVRHLFTNELWQYYQTYGFRTHKLFHILAALNARCTAWLLRVFLRRAKTVICISNKQQRIFAANGIHNTTVIYNTTHFTKPNIRAGEDILFVGRLTPGKGADVFVNALVTLSTRRKNISATIVGEGFLRKSLKEQSRRNKLKATFVGHVSYERIPQLLAKCCVVVVPSVWEEPFGRVALESLAYGVPVVASRRGGLPEIVVDKKNGAVVSPTAQDIADGIVYVTQHNKRLRAHVQKDRSALKQKFYHTPLTQHRIVYEQYC